MFDMGSDIEVLCIIIALACLFGLVLAIINNRGETSPDPGSAQDATTEEPAQDSPEGGHAEPVTDEEESPVNELADMSALMGIPYEDVSVLICPECDQALKTTVAMECCHMLACQECAQNIDTCPECHQEVTAYLPAQVIPDSLKKKQ